MIAAEPVVPGIDELMSRLEILNNNRIESAGNTAVRAERNKAAFNDKTKFSRYLDGLVVGQSVKLRSKKHKKGQPRWFGPFEIRKVLDNNVYIVADHEGIEYPRPVNGNNLRPVALQSLIMNDMWAPPPAIALCEKRADAKVTRDVLKKASAVAKVKRKLPAEAGAQNPPGPETPVLSSKVFVRTFC
ncbi:hypothetical protein PGT21_017435 [Puccinia graminis f. sp. tritici]|uniref:Uncharacterized protein n=1 Tax=Puccinia graminis f. sp. tritici TaxID=56615 RepID=A0A5B0Q5W1_PUCGR|nr:hypothetical protein PGT21_017435 [Puccinia graminis f. sp. tritici]